MRKQIRVTLTDGHIYHSMLTLNKDEYPYVFLDRDVTDDECINAMQLIATYFMQHEVNHIILDLEERNDALTPTKEMTIEEIEKQLGHKIKIVKKKNK